MYLNLLEMVPTALTWPICLWMSKDSLLKRMAIISINAEEFQVLGFSISDEAIARSGTFGLGADILFMRIYGKS